MKKLTFLIILATGVVAMSSCKKDPSSSSPVSKFMVAGSWRISYFHQGADDHTVNFNDYMFVFHDDGTLVATHSQTTTNGTWRLDDSSNEIHFSIGSVQPLSDLNKGWLPISSSATQINLSDDHSSDNEELHLSKI